ncbi:hypothetical protein H8959_017747 [Pygathrix nigripes]
MAQCPALDKVLGPCGSSKPISQQGKMRPQRQSPGVQVGASSVCSAAGPHATLCFQQRWWWRQQQQRRQPGRKHRNQRWPGRASRAVWTLHIYLK